MESKRIAVLGDPMLDVWTDLRTVRANPDDPTVPVVVFEGTQTKPGGALNVAANLAALGNVVMYFDVCGRTSADVHRLTALLARSGVGYRGLIHHTPPTPITRKERVRLDGRLLYRKDEDHYPPSTEWAPSTFDPGDAVVLVDYGKGTLGHGYVLGVVSQVLEQVLVVLDAKPALHRAFLGWRECWRPNVILKANCGEATAVIGGTDPSSWMDRVERRCRMAVITGGERGASMCGQEGWIGTCLPSSLLSAYPTVCGAGDVFTAVLTHALLQGENDWQAVQFAVNHATSLTCSGQTETLCLAREDAFFTDPDLVAG